nr:uncharacterized protein LOC112778721 [Arachis hypogaea]
MEDIHEEEVVFEVPHEKNEGDTKQEKEEVSLKEPKRKAIMDESISIPFPSMVKKAKKTPEFDLNILQIFKKVESILEKCSDPGPCLVSYWIGGVAFYGCMCDLGACVSIMPLSIFARLNLAPLKRSAAKFVLADKSVTTVVEITEDVLVTIKDLVFSVDFYILEMPPTDNGSSSSVLFGRLFLKTSKFKLDAFTGTYSFKVGDKNIKFNMEEAMRHPPEEHSILRCDVIDEVVAEIQREDHNRLHYLVIEGKDKHEDKQKEVDEDELQNLAEKEPQLEAKSELKPLPSHLKYAFLEDNQRFPVIIASELSSQEEEKLLEVLRQHKKSIGWSLADIVGIDPRMCMHRIFLQEGAWPVRQPERRVNPTILDVVKKEVTRLLDAGIIYPIFYSEWVSPVQVVLKKSGITTIKKDDGEMVTTRVQNACCLENLAKVLERCVNTNLVFNFEKCHFMVRQGIVLGHVVSDKGISVDPAKVDVITSLPQPSSVREDVDFEFDSACAEAFEELRRALTAAPIVRGPD